MITKRSSNREYSSRAIRCFFSLSSTTLSFVMPGGVAPTPPPVTGQGGETRQTARVNITPSMHSRPLVPRQKWRLTGFPLACIFYFYFVIFFVYFFLFVFSFFLPFFCFSLNFPFLFLFSFFLFVLSFFRFSSSSHSLFCCFSFILYSVFFLCLFTFFTFFFLVFFVYLSFLFYMDVTL